MGAGREVSISLDGVRDKNIMQLKKLNLALFPVRYNDKYYADALASADFTKLGSFLSLRYFTYHLFRFILLLCIIIIIHKLIKIVIRFSCSAVRSCLGCLSLGLLKNKKLTHQLG